MRRSPLLAFALAGLLLVAGLAASASAGTPVVRLRPDVKPLDTGQAVVRYSDAGHKQLRLSFTSENIGAGPLEMQPVKRECDGDPHTTTDRAAVQHIYGDTNDDGVYTPDVDTVDRAVTVGCFVYHPAHLHWHFTNYAAYRLNDLTTGAKVAGHAKVGFCMLDSIDVDGSLPGNPGTRVYGGCPDLATQGISVGWADIYGIDTPGQFIGIDGVANGVYCLVAIADPGDRIIESDESDNKARTQIRIRGDQATLLPDAC